MRLALQASRYRPGEPVRGVLHLEETEGTCTALLLRLWWAARGPEADTDEVVVAAERRLTSGPISTGVMFTFSIDTPLHPLSHEGHLVSVRWALTARIQWPGDVPDTTARVPIHLVPGPLPDRARLAATWAKQWQKHDGITWLDRVRTALKKQPLRLSRTTTHPGDTVQLSCDGEAVPHAWRLVRIEEAARREVIEHPRTGRRTVYRWTVQARTRSEGRIPLRGEPDARQAKISIPEDAAASLLLPTRRIRWEIRVSTTGQDVVAPLIMLPG